MSKTIRILRDGNLIALDPTTPTVLDLVRPKLTYTQTTFLRGEELYRARKNFAPTVQYQDYECFNLDHRDRLITQLGFLERIAEVLDDRGYKLRMRNLNPHPNPEVYAPQWDRILDDPTITLRYKQKKLLQIVAEENNGRFDCPTGYGKSFCIAMATLLFPKAKVDVLSRRVAVLCGRIYPELCSMLGHVGIVGGKMNRPGARVMCYTFGSMHHAPGDADIVFVDEVHEAAADDAASKWGRYGHAKMFGFSASHDMRLDAKDIRCEAVFGPVRLRVSYSKAVEKGMVVPIEVFWTDVIMDIDPCGDADDVEKKRLGIWSNGYRNKLIRRDARELSDDTQVLISVETLEHALYLKRRLPEYTLMFGGESVKESDWKWYAKNDLLPDNFKMMTDERRKRITDKFERGKLKKVICTPVWNVGVDMRYLQVLIRADAGGSPINDVQLPGRTSRTNAIGKEVGIVRDYRDFFNSGFNLKTKSREKSYTRMEWTQHYPDKNQRSKLRKLMNWESS